jgi:hypothetical protein
METAQERNLQWQNDPHWNDRTDADDEGTAT